MSAEATFWAWKQRGLSSTEKLVLLCLGDCHNAGTGRCDPSDKYIAEQTGLNVKTVPACRKTLIEKGLISCKTRAGKSPETTLNTTQYWDTPKTGIPKNGIPQKRVTGIPKNGVTPSPKTGNEPTKNLKRNLKDKTVFPEWLNLDVWDEYENMRGKLKSPMTEYARKLAIGNLQKFKDQGHDPHEILNASIQNSWKGLFAPKVNGNETRKPASNTKLSAAERTRQAISERRAARAAVLSGQH